jgi:hypothetical protein
VDFAKPLTSASPSLVRQSSLAESLTIVRIQERRWWRRKLRLGPDRSVRDLSEALPYSRMVIMADLRGIVGDGVSRICFLFM